MPDTHEVVGAETPEAIYTYKGDDGAPLYQVLRFAGKRFRQRRFADGVGRTTWSLEGVTPVPYRLPDLVNAAPDVPVYIFEGEKDVERANALGLLATTNSGGAGRWRAEFAPYFRGRKVVIVPDNDEPGLKHADQVATLLYREAASVRVLRLPNLEPKQDFSDWLARGHSLEEFERLAKNAPAFSPVMQTQIRRLDTVADEEVQWLWYGKIPLGKVTVLSGDPNLGKSFLTLDLAARLSRGGGWPCEKPGFSEEAGLLATSWTEPADVLLLSAEDDAADTIKPRLLLAGADLSRIHVLDGFLIPDGRETRTLRLVSLNADIERIGEAVRGLPNCRLIIIDPISAYLEGTDANSNAEVRSLLARLSALAAETRAAIVLVSHLRKAASRKAIYRTMGSLAFTAAARAVWSLTEDPQQPGRRLLVPVKLNLLQFPTGCAFEIVEGRVEWEAGPVLMTADEITPEADCDASHADRVSEAVEWLQNFLKDGAVPSTEIQVAARRQRIGRTVLWEAKQAAGVLAKRDGVNRRWLWELPGEEKADGQLSLGLEA